MKKLIALSMMLVSTISFACINLSGKYITSENIRYSLIQNDCAKMDMLDANSKLSIVFDGKQQLIYDYELIDEGAVIGRMQVFIKSKLEDKRWVYDEQAIKSFNNGNVETELSWSEVYLNKNTDLVTIKHKSDGSLEAYLDKRE